MRQKLLKITAFVEAGKLHDLLRGAASGSRPAHGSDSALEYAKRIATGMWERDWKQDSPHWQPLNDTLGILTQIDNMIAGMRRKRTGETWTQAPPDRDGQGYWWWWSGDDDHAPVIITVMYSGAGDKCFVCQTDDPQTRDVDNERWSGWWKRIQDEAPPNE